MFRPNTTASYQGYQQPDIKVFCTVSHKSHDPCFHVFLMETGVMTFVAHCTRDIMSCHPLDTSIKLRDGNIFRFEGMVNIYPGYFSG